MRPYVRATCNPEPGSWVAKFIDWWIDPHTGFPIPERSGVIRYYVRVNDKLHWADTAQELISKFGPEYAENTKSFTFIPAKLTDNQILMKIDPGYRANLMALPTVERRKLLDGNWKAHEGGLIREEFIRKYNHRGDHVIVDDRLCDASKLRRFASIDTAGTSQQKADEHKGKSHSYSVVAVWDYTPQHNMLILLHVWRARVEYVELERTVPQVLKQWNCRRVAVENAHFGSILGQSLKRGGYTVDLLPTKLPGQLSTNREAKYDRAVAAGLISRIENGWFAVPHDAPWLRDYIAELCAWQGIPDEVADQIDVTSYAAYFGPRMAAKWDGAVNVPIATAGPRRVYAH